VANVLIYRIEFLTSNPNTAFVAGDILDIYLETDDAVVPAIGPFVSTGITVELNGASYPALGADHFFLVTEGVDYIVNRFNPQICIGTSLLQFSLDGVFWPYGMYISHADHFSCAVNPPTCDLMVVGVPEIVPASDQTTADGAITLNATSTEAIEYKLGSDFSYGDGTGQASNIFSGLLPGDHRIFLRDAANCAVNVLVTVGINNTFGTKFRLTYEDINGWLTRLDIKKRGYSGAITEIVGDTISPFEISLRGEGEIDKFTALISIDAIFQLASITDGQFLEIYTNDPQLYRIEYAKDLGNVLPPFTPAALAALDDWLESGSNYAWSNIGTLTPDFALAGSGSSKNLYTDYSFDPGQEYSFDYEFLVSGAGGYNRIIIEITNSGFADLGEKLTIDVSTPGTFTGTYTFICPNGATRIRIYISQSSGGTNYSVIDFSNATASTVSDTPVGYEVKLITKVLPQQYIEEFTNTPYGVKVIATDSLPELKDIILVQDSGQKYTGDIKLIKLIAHCLSKLKLDLPIRVACNLYATSMAQTDSDDPFDQAYIDFEAFYIEEEEPKMDFVLRSILEAFNARLIQWEGRWNIVRIEEMADEYDYRDFDKNGDFIESGTYDPIKTINRPAVASDGKFCNSDQELEFRPGYGSLKVIYKLGLKRNILENGDFKLIINPPSLQINREHWTLVNAGYTLEEGFEAIDENNVAYTLTSREDTLSSVNGGEAYLQSGSYSVKMGTNNQLKISLRAKVTRTRAQFATINFAIEVPYVKVRVRVKYGSLYLQGNGGWGSTVNVLTFFLEEWDKYTDFEIIAQQPTLGTPVSGMDLDVRVYHAYAYHADFQTLANLKAFDTYDSGASAQVLPTGYKTQLRDDFTLPSSIYFFELEETTDAENLTDYSIVRPDDYNAGTNPRQWVKKVKQSVGSANGTNVFPFYLDKVVLNFLTDGKDPIDAIVRTSIGEASNKQTFEKELIIGSYSNLIVTEQSFGISVGFGPSAGSLNIITRNILSSDLIYTGYLRDVDGVGYELWARDGVAESDKLHGIWLKEYTKQYKRSWQLMRGSFELRGSYIGFLNALRVVHNGNKVFIPIGLTLKDRDCEYSGEMLELNSNAVGSDGSESSPYSSGFSIGFGASGFN
jgi:hypothetical protein